MHASKLPLLSRVASTLASMDAATWAARQPGPLLVFSREKALTERTLDLLGSAGMALGGGSWSMQPLGSFDRTTVDDIETRPGTATFEIDATSHVYAFPADATAVRVGRDPSLELTIDRWSISKVHARFECRGGVWTVFDAGSRNGTFVDGVRVGDQGTMLFLGEVIQLATGVQMKFFNTESFYEQFRELGAPS